MVLLLILRLYIILSVYTWILSHDTMILHVILLHCRLWQLTILHNVLLLSYVIISQSKPHLIPKTAFVYVKLWMLFQDIACIIIIRRTITHVIELTFILSYKILHSLGQCRRKIMIGWILSNYFQYSQKGWSCHNAPIFIQWNIR